MGAGADGHQRGLRVRAESGSRFGPVPDQRVAPPWSRNRREILARWYRVLAAPADRVPRPRGVRALARRLRRRHRAPEDPQWRGEDQPGPGELPDFTADGTDLAEHRTGSVGCGPSMGTSTRSSTHGRAPGAVPIQRRRHPTAFDKTLVPRVPHHAAAHPGGQATGTSSTPGGAEAYADRMITATTSRHPTSRERSCTVISSAPTTWSTTRADRRVIFHGELSLEKHYAPAPGFAADRTPIAGPVLRQFRHIAGGGACASPRRREAAAI
jgi:hypothetical protein